LWPGTLSQGLAARFDAKVIGIDPSEKMLDQARSKDPDHRIRYEAGRGESIPPPDNSIDLIFMSMIFHYFDNPHLAARECRRVLRGGEQLFCAPPLVNAFHLILTLNFSRKASLFCKSAFPPTRSCVRFLRELDFKW
jgi:Methylase involved in ubiquinone/menaquinone biosynthesis